MTLMKASVIIPTLNEADAIRDVVSAVRRVVPESEVLVVDCSSKDGTPEIAKEAGAIVIDDPRPGYGRAILTGLERAQGEVIAVIDGDGSYEADDIPKTILPILNGETDLVLASRLGGKIFPEAMPKINHIGNYLLTWIYNTLYNQSVTDTQTGLRSIRREAFEKYRKLRTETGEKALGVLTAEQKKAFEDMKGEKIELEIRRRQR